MNRRFQKLARCLLLIGSSGFLFQGGAGCARFIQQNTEVLFAAEANPTLIYDSWVYNKLGPGIISFFARH